MYAPWNSDVNTVEVETAVGIKTSITSEIAQEKTLHTQHVAKPSIAKIEPVEEKPKQTKIKIDVKQETDAGELVSEIDKGIFSVMLGEEHMNDDLIAGEGINASYFFDPDYRPSLFVPMYSKSMVVGILIYREYEEGRRLGIAATIDEKWYTYPPVMAYEAETELINKYPNLFFTNIPGYYYIEDGETPYYLYEGSEDDATRYYLVSSYSKAIVIKEDREIDEIEEEEIPARLNSEGLIEIDKTASEKLSSPELEKFKADVALLNNYIKNGIMKLDENMNVVFDKRSKQDLENENKVLNVEPSADQQRRPYDDSVLESVEIIIP
jgi:hypothetical protein